MSKLSWEQARVAVLEAIGSVAPDVESELSTIDPSCDAFEELQLDSMDHLNIMTRLAEATGIEIGESEYQQLRSLDSLIRHLSAEHA